MNNTVCQRCGAVIDGIQQCPSMNPTCSVFVASQANSSDESFFDGAATALVDVADTIVNIQIVETVSDIVGGIFDSISDIDL